MKFLTDQDVYAATVRFLSDHGHDVVSASQLGLSRAEDGELLRVAQEQDRVLVTRDRDYGSLVIALGGGPGVIYLRILPSTLKAVHSEFERILGAYSEPELLSSFIVVEPGRHRIRRPTPRTFGDSLGP
jgi:predicted nuclease of predicted toxin-antitoxin system